jgi:hypothetical protein
MERLERGEREDSQTISLTKPVFKSGGAEQQSSIYCDKNLKITPILLLFCSTELDFPTCKIFFQPNVAKGPKTRRLVLKRTEF